MDCEKFESTMLDELYDELDELTSAAAKRHVAGCARCAALFGGLRATRRVAVLPLVDPPADLEDRILAAARHAQKVVPLRGRVARGVSALGAWAMRPQTAMAALFLLMIGSSVLLLRGRNKTASTGSVTVTEEGAPTPTTETALDSTRQKKTDLAFAYSAHGTSAANATAAPAASGADGYVASRDRGEAKDKEAQRRARVVQGESNGDELALNAGPPGGARDPNATNGGLPPAPPQAAPPAVTATAAAAAAEAPAQAGGGAEGSAYHQAMTLYHGRKWSEAYNAFRSISGNTTAELYAARSLRGMSGCGAAAAQFDALANRAWGTNPGHDAALDAARCYRDMGNAAAAKAWLQRLLQTNYAALAREELQALENPPVAKPAAPPAATQKAGRDVGF